MALVASAGANDPRVGAIERNPAPISGWQRHKSPKTSSTDPRSLALPDSATLLAGLQTPCGLLVTMNRAVPEESRDGPINYSDAVSQRP